MLKVPFSHGWKLPVTLIVSKLNTLIEGSEGGDVLSVAGKTGAVSLVPADVGLSAVNNTSDSDKPISSLQQAALDSKVNNSSKGVANGVATLGADGLIPTSQIGSISTGDTFVVTSQVEQLATGATVGDIAIRTDSNLTYILQTLPATVLGNWIQLLTPTSVGSVAGKTGNVTLNKTDVGLSAVDNTSDANKPVSVATQTVLDSKQGSITGAATTITSANLTAGRVLASDVSGKVGATTITSTELANLFTLGTTVVASGTDTFVADVAETVATVTITAGTWLVWGGLAVNQSVVKATSNYVAAIITPTPASFTSEASIVANANGTLTRMAGGADAGMSITPRLFTVASSTVISLVAISDFDTEASAVRSTLTAVKVGL